MNFNFIVSRLVIIFYLVNLTVGLNVGDKCFLYDNSEEGVCELLIDCLSALAGLRKQPPEQAFECGYDGFKKIVCCRSSSPKTVDNIKVLSKREQKCFEYTNIIHLTVHGLGLSAEPLATSVNISKCVLDSTGLVVGGYPAKTGEFPHMALLGFVSKTDPNSVKWGCGGSLVSENYVLTAAHCSYNRNYGPLRRVRLGSLFRPSDLTLNNENDQNLQEFRIINFIKHPLYSFSTLTNDIALVKLDQFVTFNEFVRPLCLPIEDTSDVNRKMVATGWGNTLSSGSESDQLLKVVLEHFSRSDCQKTNRQRIDESLVCAGYQNESRDTCLGDSGGPLQVIHSKMHCMYEIIGVTSYGSSARCGIIGIPAIYTNVANYVEWIELVVW